MKQYLITSDELNTYKIRKVAMVSHYEVLGVNPEASEAEVRRQYQVLAVRLHPDKPAGSHQQFTQLQEAYTVLADPHQRAEYDIQLKRDQVICLFFFLISLRSITILC